MIVLDQGGQEIFGLCKAGISITFWDHFSTLEHLQSSVKAVRMKKAVGDLVYYAAYMYWALVVHLASDTLYKLGLQFLSDIRTGTDSALKRPRFVDTPGSQYGNWNCEECSVSVACEWPQTSLRNGK